MLQEIFDLFQGFVQRLLQVLPTSPFRSFIDSIPELPYLPELNWFFPVSECLTILTAWLLAIGIYYLWSVVMRWVKLIGD